jgi:hypothetical protein
MTDALGRALQATTGNGDAAILFSQRDFSPLGTDQRAVSALHKVKK